MTWKKITLGIVSIIMLILLTCFVSLYNYAQAVVEFGNPGPPQVGKDSIIVYDLQNEKWNVYHVKDIKE